MTGIARSIGIAALCAAAAALCAAQAATKSAEPPPPRVQWEASALGGYQKVQASCTACHSAEYIEYLPPGSNRAFWTAMVKRMKVEFKAPIADADLPDIVDYLVRTYGDEQTVK